jgi:hypothetical protein
MLKKKGEKGGGFLVEERKRRKRERKRKRKKVETCTGRGK